VGHTYKTANAGFSDFPISKTTTSRTSGIRPLTLYPLSCDNTMLSVDLTEYKSSIILWSQERMTAATIIDNLFTEFSITVSLRTLQRRMKEWNIARYRRHSAVQISLIKVRISVHFLSNFNDIEIHRALQVEGFLEISLRTIARWRRDIGIYRLQSIHIQETTAAELRRVVGQELDNGTIEGYGKTLLQTHFRAMGIHASRFDYLLISIYTYTNKAI
jgi:hypothetical protein